MENVVFLTKVHVLRLCWPLLRICTQTLQIAAFGLRVDPLLLYMPFYITY